mmetsp:Transcript_17124/g.28160  ORF Transcript_17124/g.28160 Transcript_17124/m.28160 type:complete len:224 (+) Transcript_17124:68-739(+)|eukprot:CAMPEP_0184655344 /NCGR_PEP_ID=MMETSP0308-20130426/12950_1 /TAXON_ID=38269 /ORGANISM="Gloeochaete witrockiana, Strain SAG 46.84" /LENGTH=223 /DNA_ID=CAMNT_0027091753 /DNA_START=67 /DNA_END=738 /DNA_ORIENTATION=+
MGISRSSFHKRRATGGKPKLYRKKRKFELGRQSANTKIGAKRLRTVRVRGGALKYRALRLEAGNFAWGSEGVTRKSRILDVVYNASNNELVRTKTLVKNAIIQIDSTPFRQWYEQHYGVVLGKKKKKAAAKDDDDEAETPADKKEDATAEKADTKKSNHVQRKLQKRQQGRKLDVALNDQFSQGRLFVCISSRPGQSGRCDGYVLEGKELEFYSKKIHMKKKK